MFCYQCCYDRIKGEALLEDTDEYFYRDVVSVATKTNTKQFDVDVTLKGNKEKVTLRTSETFVLTTSGGTAFSVFLQDPALLNLKLTKDGQLDTSQAEKAIQAIRKMLREKKSGGASVASAPAPAPLPPAHVRNPRSGDDHTAKLRKLKELLTEGLIDQAEFDAEKKKILAGL